MNKLVLLGGFAACLLGFNAAWAASGLSSADESDAVTVPVPIEDLNVKNRILEDTKKKEEQKKKQNMTEAEQKLLDNVNREAILKNWKRECRSNETAINCQYKHVGGKKAVVILYKLNPDKYSIEQIMRNYAKVYNASEQDIRIKSEALYSLVIDLNDAKHNENDKKDKPADTAEKKGIAQNKMMLYVYKEPGSHEYTTMYVLGQTEEKDLEYIVQNFFDELARM